MSCFVHANNNNDNRRVLRSGKRYPVVVVAEDPESESEPEEEEEAVDLRAEVAELKSEEKEDPFAYLTVRDSEPESVSAPESRIQRGGGGGLAVVAEAAERQSSFFRTALVAVVVAALLAVTCLVAGFVVMEHRKTELETALAAMTAERDHFEQSTFMFRRAATQCVDSAKNSASSVMFSASAVKDAFAAMTSNDNGSQMAGALEMQLTNLTLATPTLLWQQGTAPAYNASEIMDSFKDTASSARFVNDTMHVMYDAFACEVLSAVYNSPEYATLFATGGDEATACSMSKVCLLLAKYLTDPAGLVKPSRHAELMDILESSFSFLMSALMRNRTTTDAVERVLNATEETDENGGNESLPITRVALKLVEPVKKELSDVIAKVTLGARVFHSKVAVPVANSAQLAMDTAQNLLTTARGLEQVVMEQTSDVFKSMEAKAVGGWKEVTDLVKHVFTMAAVIMVSLLLILICLRCSSSSTGTHTIVLRDNRE
jgi:hypothetical protein